MEKLLTGWNRLAKNSIRADFRDDEKTTLNTRDAERGGRMQRAVKCLVIMTVMLASVAMMAQLALEVEGGAQKTISQAEFQALPHQTLTVTNPHTQKQEKYEGVPLRALLDMVAVPSGEKLRGAEGRDYIVICAKDGYEVVLALEEIDPTFQQNLVLVADTLDGKPLDDKHGPLQLVVPEDQRPARWVRMISKISVRRTP
jgi:hypothetical protein